MRAKYPDGYGSSSYAHSYVELLSNNSVRIYEGPKLHIINQHYVLQNSTVSKITKVFYSNILTSLNLSGTVNNKLRCFA